MKSLIVPLTLDIAAKRGWTVKVNGEEVDAAHVKITNPKIGTLEYGKSPSGDYDTWGFHENGGGGSVIVPFTAIDGKIYVGVLEQRRPNQQLEGTVRNCPRGFLQPGKNHFETADAELGEELGLSSEVPVNLFELAGDGGNPNSTFFATWGTKPDGSPEGIRFYGLEVDSRILVHDGVVYRIRPNLLKADAQSDTARLAEGILGAVFIPLSQASRLGDMMTMSGICRLRAELDARAEQPLE